jgi:hypothetical protein
MAATLALYRGTHGMPALVRTRQPHEALDELLRVFSVHPPTTGYRVTVLDVLLLQHGLCG